MLIYSNQKGVSMIKKIFIFTVVAIFVGCGQKPIVVKGKINDIKNTNRQKVILGQNVKNKKEEVYENPLQNPSLILGSELNQTIPNQTQIENNITVESNATNETLQDAEPIMNPELSQSYVATMKTKKFSYSDAAFMQEENGVIDLQILNAGKPLVTLKISSDICVNHNCISKEEFNHEYLSSAYPNDLINNVLTKKPIFEGKNLRQITGGFMQRLQSSQYDIKYKTTPGSIYFKDLKNNIVIKLRRLK